MLLGTRLLAEVQQCPTPLLQDGRVVAMVIEIKQLDQDWGHCDAPEPLSEEESRNLENELIALLEQEMAGHRSRKWAGWAVNP